MNEPFPRFEPGVLLKRDLFGAVERGTWITAEGSRIPATRRSAESAARALRGVARLLLRRERRALEALADLPGVPRLIEGRRAELVRSWIEGRPLQQGGPPDAGWHARARHLLVQLHRRGVAHNDLAKEPNLLVTPDGGAALIDFQLASCRERRGRWFRSMAREDLRHLLKHKRHYHAALLRPRERAILARSGGIARLWRRAGKPLYLFVTRHLLGWRDREGAGDRSHRPTAP
ncbi:MAG: serine/threonine protein kinase [Planctomycetes bacterium]|nr:serine/threonine protein kinase [Planctomycetota bacterium]